VCLWSITGNSYASLPLPHGIKGKFLIRIASSGIVMLWFVQKNHCLIYI
jgi:hypothetical protein